HYLAIDPYANACNRAPDSSHWDEDEPERDNPWAWERKFELDSLSYGPDLAWRLWWATGDTSWADERFVPAARAILATVATEEPHEGRPPYVCRRSRERTSRYSSVATVASVDLNRTRMHSSHVSISYSV